MAAFELPEIRFHGLSWLLARLLASLASEEGTDSGHDLVASRQEGSDRRVLRAGFARLASTSRNSVESGIAVFSVMLCLERLDQRQAQPIGFALRQHRQPFGNPVLHAAIISEQALRLTVGKGIVCLQTAKPFLKRFTPAS